MASMVMLEIYDAEFLEKVFACIPEKIDNNFDDQLNGFKSFVGMKTDSKFIEYK